MAHHPQEAKIQVAEKEMSGISDATFVVVLLPGGRGTHAELGAAIISRKRIYLYDPEGEVEKGNRGEATCIFYYHPSVVFYSTLDDLYVAIIRNEGDPNSNETPFRSFVDGWDLITKEVHKTASEKGFWKDYDRAVEMTNLAETESLLWIMSALHSQKLMLIGDELSEAHEAVRSGNPPSVKAEGFSQMEEELADAVIRIMDFSGKLGLDIPGAMLAKMAYNAKRPHMHGRKF
jgi:NTP pyrophosphatase (non-canonical NTP hydrolase)